MRPSSPHTPSSGPEATAGPASLSAVRTVEEVWLLLSETLSLWGRAFTRLATWFCLGFAAHHAALIASAWIGADHDVIATIVFVLGVMAQMASLVLMIHALRPFLRSPAAVRAATTVAPHHVPASVFAEERTGPALAAALGPFLAVYAVWGLVHDQVQQLFVMNYLLSGLGGVDNWSINLSRFWFYLLLAAGAWVAKQALELVRHRRFVPPAVRPFAAGVAVVLDGMWVFASFLAAIGVVQRLGDWLTGRVLWRWWAGGWHDLVDTLPVVHLPFHLTLPQIVTGTAQWIWTSGLPAFSLNMVLPLMWLALTAIVLGWRTFSGRDALSGVHRPAAADRLVRRAAGWSGSRLQPLVTLADWASGDLRTKYVPVLQALRLVLRAGPRFVGAYLVLAAVLNLGSGWFSVLIVRMLGPLPAATSLGVQPVIDLITGVVFTTLGMALYAAAFDRTVADATGVGRRERRLRRSVHRTPDPVG